MDRNDRIALSPVILSYFRVGELAVLTVSAIGMMEAGSD
jgi:hypothetical protein